MDPHAPFTLLVPSSTSNLGPGFDCLGLALSLWLKVQVRGLAQGSESRLVECSGTASGWPLGPDNKLLIAYQRAHQALGRPAPALELAVHSEIPMARGLGSSGAAIAAGLCLAWKLAGRTFDDPLLLKLGLELEGHPDNSTAALLGGLTLAVPLADGELRVIQAPLHASLGFALAWSPMRLATQTARAVLPSSVPFAQACENPRRLALLLAGLASGNPDWIQHGILDQLHMAYRLPLIPGAAAALESARAEGAYAATISGSGSALVAIGAKGSMSQIAQALAHHLERAHGAATARVVDVVYGPPRVEL